MRWRNDLAGLDNALRALTDGLGSLWAHTAVLVVTEFGPTAAVNGYAAPITARGLAPSSSSARFMAAA